MHTVLVASVIVIENGIAEDLEIMNETASELTPGLVSAQSPS
jgi:hypothetical protein